MGLSGAHIFDSSFTFMCHNPHGLNHENRIYNTQMFPPQHDTSSINGMSFSTRILLIFADLTLLECFKFLSNPNAVRHHLSRRKSHIPVYCGVRKSRAFKVVSFILPWRHKLLYSWCLSWAVL